MSHHPPVPHALTRPNRRIPNVPVIRAFSSFSSSSTRCPSLNSNPSSAAPVQISSRWSAAMSELLSELLSDLLSEYQMQSVCYNQPMRTVELPQDLREAFAKVLPFQPDTAQSFFALAESQATRSDERKIVVRLRDEQDKPLAGTLVTQEWPDGHESLASNVEGEVVFFLGPGSRFMPPRGGPHRVYVGQPESLHSDMIYSLGSPGGQAMVYCLVFKATMGS